MLPKRLVTAAKISIALIVPCVRLLIFAQAVIAEHPPQCGGTLTATRGIIQSPSFPGEFQVPITCTWVIDASELSLPNRSIVIYLTQLFVSEGLTFEEYETYDPVYNIPGRTIHEVLENNVSKIKWVETRQNVLVVTFRLESIENTHLRILDYFLDVYGFNMTYEITSEGARVDACIMSDCGFTGTCYYDFSDFFCRCFMGYSGESCSHGPNSLCSPDGESYCENGGICQLVGTAFASCNCAQGYTGERCETTLGGAASSRHACSKSSQSEHGCTNCTAGGKSPASRQLNIDGSYLVLEKDGTEIPDDETILIYLKSEVIQVLEKNETWHPENKNTLHEDNIESVSNGSTISITDIPNNMNENLIKDPLEIVSIDNNYEILWTDFVIPWQKVPFYLLKACENGDRQKHLITEIIHIIVNFMREIKTNIPSKAFKIIANKIIEKYPTMFKDIDEDGTTMGDGSHSLFCKLLDRNTYLSRPHKLKRKCEVEDCRTLKKKINLEAGCSNWQPQELLDCDKMKKQLQISDLPKDDNFYCLLEKCYANQRKFLNNINNPPTIDDIKKEWPVFFSKEVIQWHFKKLTNANITDIGSGLKLKSQKILKLGRFKKFQFDENDLEEISTLKCISLYFKETFNDFLKIIYKVAAFKISADQIQIPELNYHEWGTEALVYFYGLKKDRKRLEALINRWKNSGSIGHLNLLDKSTAVINNNELRPFVKSLTIDRQGLIREDEEFVLSCAAQGSSRMMFRWYKDHVPINVTQFTNKWTRLISDPHVKNQYTSVLGVDKTSYLDSGTFVCEAEDFGIKQCMSKAVEIRKPPVIKIEPMTLTVQKGENFTIKCICLSSNRSDRNRYTYSWTKNRELLPIKTEQEKYEILYPGGSLLQVSRIERPTLYSCLVQGELTSSEVSIQVDVIDRTLVRTCRGEKHMNILWPETSPGSQSVQECPKGFGGIVTRWCILHDSERSLWQTPDFSQCTAYPLTEIDTAFRRLTLGYVEGDVLSYLIGYGDYLKTRETLLAGEGARILSLANDIISHVNRSRRYDLIGNVTRGVFDILDQVLTHETSLINQMHVVQLQEVVSNQIDLSKYLLNESLSYHVALGHIDVSLAKLNHQLSIPLEKENYPSWYMYKLDVLFNQPQKSELLSNPLSLGCVVYKDLKSYLPSRSVIRLHDGTEMEYEILSKITAVFLLDRKRQDDEDEFTFSMEFLHGPVNTTMNRWNVNCSSASYANYGYMWNINACITEIVNSTKTKCVCYKPGTYAVLVTTVPVTMAVEVYNSYQTLVLIGCCSCLLFATLTTIVLVMHWTLKKRSTTFLKIQYCVAIAGAMIIFATALSKELANDAYAYINTFLEIFLLIALTSHISKCLIAFTEFVQLSRAPNLNKTIVAISTGVPVLTVFASHLTHRTIGKKQSSWWLINGSVSFNIFFTVSVIMVFLYNTVFVLVMDKLNKTSKGQNKTASLALERKGLLRRSFVIFWFTVFMIFASVMYVNIKDSQIWHYAFTASNIFLAMTFFFCYICKPETSFLPDLVESLSSNPIVKNPDEDMSRSPLRAISDDFEKRSSVSWADQQSPLDLSSKSSANLSDLQNIPNYAAQNSYSPPSNGTSPKSPRDNISLDVIRPTTSSKFQSFKDCLRQQNNHLQQQEETFCGNKQTAEVQQNYLYSPDVVATRVHVELDLVTPIVHDPNCEHKHATSEETAPIILCNIAVNSRCQVNSAGNSNPGNFPPFILDQKGASDVSFENVQKMARPACDKISSTNELEVICEGDERAELECQVIEDDAQPPSSSSSSARKASSSGGDSLDGMLDKISHDLDYLLNRRKSACSAENGDIVESL